MRDVDAPDAELVAAVPVLGRSTHGKGGWPRGDTAFMRRCLYLVLAVGLAVTAVGCAFSDDAPSDGASSVPSPGLHSRTGPPPSPSPVPTATDNTNDMSASLGADVWRFRQSVAAAFAAHSEVLKTDAEMASVTLAPDTSIEDAAALMAALRVEVAADAAECVDSEHATCGAGWDLRWSLQGTEIRLELPPVPPDYPADEVRALDVVATTVGTATEVDVYRSLLPPGRLLVSVDRQAEGDVPSRPCPISSRPSPMTLRTARSATWSASRPVTASRS